jgi:hypothetical protein
MAQTQDDLLQELLDTARTLPAEKLAEVLDFAGYLRQRQSDASRPEPGSADAILSHAGALRLEPGELDQLLIDIARMRELDLTSHA